MSLEGEGKGVYGGSRLAGPVGCDIVTTGLDIKELRHRCSLSVSRRLLYFSHITKQKIKEKHVSGIFFVLFKLA